MKTANGIPLNTVRGQVRGWIEQHAGKLGADVLELGSRLHIPGAWWCVNRDLAQGEWLGVDIQNGEGVDQIADLHDLPEEWTDRFTGLLCSEVLEHVQEPWRAVHELRRVLQPGGIAIFTVPACFPQHAFPDDYYRFTESGLRALLEYGGFNEIETASAGNVDFVLDDHGDGRTAQRSTAMHTLAVARA